MSDVPEAPPAPRPPLTTTTSLWPAGVILGLAVVMLGVFIFIDFATNKGVVTVPTTIPVVVGGLPLDAKPGPALRYCLQSEEVPSNIDSAFIVPDDTVPRPGANTPDLGAGEYDCYEPMATTGATAASLINFFNTQLEARGWDLFSRGASNGTPQSLFQKAGDDGFYWELGVTVDKSSASRVNWTFTIYQNSETD
ncbi:MAG: hypothetical protein ACRDVC_05870 [Acidimicrobiales bacterium]